MEDKLFLTWEEYTKDCYALANKIRKHDQPFEGIVAIARGGLVTAGIIAPLLGIRVVESLCLESYSEEGERGKMIQHNDPPIYVLDEPVGFLVVDDLVDSGHTINHTNNLGLTDSAVLYRKSNTEFEPTFFARELPAEKWIVFPWEV
jgi:xanthine phosphoribosyltransferase